MLISILSSTTNKWSSCILRLHPVPPICCRHHVSFPAALFLTSENSSLCWNLTNVKEGKTNGKFVQFIWHLSDSLPSLLEHSCQFHRLQRPRRRTQKNHPAEGLWRFVNKTLTIKEKSTARSLRIQAPLEATAQPKRVLGKGGLIWLLNAGAFQCK